MPDINLEDGTINPPSDVDLTAEIGDGRGGGSSSSIAEQAIAANLARLGAIPEASLPPAGSGSLRYPNKYINENGDYVLFKFKKYQAPFCNRKKVGV